MESTNSQSSLNGRAQAQSIGTDAERLPSYDIGNEVNSMANVAAAISGNTAVALAQLSRARNRNSVAQTTRSSDPRVHTPQFQEHRRNSTLRALEKMRLNSEAKAIPQPTVTCNEYKNSSERLRHVHPRPPTPPRPSQKRLGKKEVESHWDEDGNHINVPPTTANHAGWDEDRIDEASDDATSKHNIRNDEMTAREGSQVDDDELKDGMADHCSKGGDSPRSTRFYTQEELAILTRKIFGDEDEDDDGAFWDEADEAHRTTIDHPATDEEASVDHQDRESDTGEQSEESEGKANETSKSDSLFGHTSNLCLSTSKDNLPRSHQNDDDGQTAEVVQDVLETVASSATVDTSGGMNSSEDDRPPTMTTPTLLTSQESPCTALSPSLPTERLLPPESGIGIRLTKGGAPTGNLRAGESLEADVEPSEGLSDPLPSPATQLDPSAEEMEPRKPAAVAPSEEEPHCKTIRHIIRKRGLPDFSPTRPGIFSALNPNSSDAASLGKRKRSREDDEYEGDAAFSSASIPRCDHQVLRPRALKKSKVEENSSERSLAILALNRLPEPSPVKRRTGNSGSPSPQCQFSNFGPSNEIGTPPRTPPVSGGLPAPKPHSAKTKGKHDEAPSIRDSPHQATTVSSPLATTTATTSPNPASPNDLPKACTKESSSSSPPINRKRKNREDDEDCPSTSEVPSRPIKKPRRLAHIPFTATKRSLVFKIKAHYEQMPLKRTGRISHPLASETVKDVTEMIKELDVKDSFRTNGKKFFPRKDYTPYVTHVDCRDKSGPSSGPGFPSSSNDGDDE